MTVRERLVASVTDIRDRGQRLAQLNLELLTSELKEKGKRFGAAIGLFVGAGVLAFYAVGFAMATIVVALALVLPLWLALLLVTVLLLLLIAVMVQVGRGQIERAAKRAPLSAPAEARRTADLVKANVRQTKTVVRDRASRVARRDPGEGAHVPPTEPPTVPPTESGVSGS
jgi:membrane protein implicated in regulation of membrane protease activity